MLHSLHLARFALKLEAVAWMGAGATRPSTVQTAGLQLSA